MQWGKKEFIIRKLPLQAVIALWRGVLFALFCDLTRFGTLSLTHNWVVPPSGVFAVRGALVELHPGFSYKLVHIPVLHDGTRAPGRHLDLPTRGCILRDPRVAPMANLPDHLDHRQHQPHRLPLGSVSLSRLDGHPLSISSSCMWWCCLRRVGGAF